MQHARDYDDAELGREFPGRALHQGLAQLRLDLIQLFVDPIPAQVADLERVASEQDFDVMLHDMSFLGMGPFAERSGIPYATYGISALTFPSVDTVPFGLGLGPTPSLIDNVAKRLDELWTEMGSDGVEDVVYITYSEGRA